MKIRQSLASLSMTLLASSSWAGQVTFIPGPDDQGGMIMPSVSIQGTSGSGTNPSAGLVRINFNQTQTPVLRSTEAWAPGTWYEGTAAWGDDLGSPAGIGGTPVANAGSGDLFNNQYGFMFMGMGTSMMAFVPTGNSLAIRLESVSSPLLEAYNYGASANRWDRIFGNVGSQVLWNGSMWHNYFTIPANAPAGTYTATFEIFVASTAFSGATGFAQYDNAALAAVKNPNFTPASLTYTFTVVPEPSTAVFTGLGCALFLNLRRRKGFKSPQGCSA